MAGKKSLTRGLVVVAFFLLALVNGQAKAQCGCNLEDIVEVKAPAGFAVVNNTLIEVASGMAQVLYGVCRPSLEWDPCGQSLSANDYQLMRNVWAAQAVRISLNQDFWLAGSSIHSGDYQCVVRQQVNWARAAGLAIILDLHWSDCGNLNLGKACQMPMADVNSVQFWKEVADQYKNQGDIFFELYNEPFLTSWDAWRNGGYIPSSGGCCNQDSYQAVGMQALYDAIRSVGANNVIIVGGINWSYDLTGVSQGFALSGSNIIYNTHPYDYPGKGPDDWERAFGHLASQYPLIATEFGNYCHDNDYNAQLIQYARSKNMGWTAWAWWAGDCNFPSIIADWDARPLGNTGATILQGLHSLSKEHKSNNNNKNNNKQLFFQKQTRSN